MGSVVGEQVSDLGVQGGDAMVEIVDVAGQFADAARGDSLGQSVAERDALELSQLSLAIAAQGPGFGDGVVLGPVRAQPLDGLGAVSHKPAALQLEHRQRPHDLGLLRRPEILS
ncbi:MAG: hypothetical protein ACXVH3_37600 [Solirubrobacteraceae bacterium]